MDDSLSLAQAITCVSRPIQRAALPKKYNPKWGVPGDLKGKQVVKACASTLNSGVKIIPNESVLPDVLPTIEKGAISEINRLKRVGGYKPVLVEEYLEGPAFEIDGVCGPRGLEICFNGLQQTWQGEKIIKYEIVARSIQVELEEVAAEITHTLGLRRCGFSIELRSNPWKVIEINGRVGEDGGDYYSLLSPTINPMQVLFDICNKP